MMKNELRECGIYQLPDNREFVVGLGHKGACILFNLQSWLNGGQADYLIHENGKILSRGIPTKWSVDDLTDTGRTAPDREA